uniref:Tetraspanin 37 n=1 Tax=Oreochromis aureus TaxID=47969 RepID=A0AAZ1X971_OREAU
MAPFSGVFENYTGSSEDSNSRSVDALQEELKCCGVKNYTDWLETTWFNKSGGLRFPHSCCNVTFPTCNGTVHQPWQIYTQGCQEELWKIIQFALKMVIWSSLLVYVVEVRKTLNISELHIVYTLHMKCTPERKMKHWQIVIMRASFNLIFNFSLAKYLAQYLICKFNFIYTVPDHNNSHLKAVYIVR